MDKQKKTATELEEIVKQRIGAGDFKVTVHTNPETGWHATIYGRHPAHGRVDRRRTVPALRPGRIAPRRRPVKNPPPFLGKVTPPRSKKQLNAQMLCRSGRQLASNDDSPKGCDMTPIEFREKKTREIQELLEKLSSLDGTSYSSENKDRLFRTY